MFILVLLALWYFGSAYTPDVQDLASRLERVPFLWRGAVYILLYVVVTFFLFFSKDVFWFAGALLFGAVYSTVFICMAEALNAVILFHLSRRFGRAYTQRVVSRKYATLDERLGKLSFLWLFLFRAAPLIPYRFMDLAAGLTALPFRKYFAAVVFGSWLKMYWIQFILSAVGTTLIEGRLKPDPRVLVEYFMENPAILWVSMVYVIAVVAVVVKLKDSNKK